MTKIPVTGVQIARKADTRKNMLTSPFAVSVPVGEQNQLARPKVYLW